MQKHKSLGLLAILGALTLIGAGCQPTVVPASVPADSGAGMEEKSESVMEDRNVSITDEGSSTEARVFNVGGVNFAFDVTEIRVNKGDTVTINFTSTDGFHDWVVDEFNAATEQVRTGSSSSVTFVADKAGIFEYYCSVGQHRANGMVGKLIVE